MAEEARPRRPIVGMLFAVSAGAFIARVASQLLAPGPLGAFDFIVYLGLALSVALAYRRFVRNALIQRRRERARRAGAAPADASPAAEGPSRPRRRRPRA